MNDSMKAILTGTLGIIAGVALTIFSVSSLNKLVIDTAADIGAVGGRLEEQELKLEALSKSTVSSADKINKIEKQAVNYLRELELQRARLNDVNTKITNLLNDITGVSGEEALQKLEQFKSIVASVDSSIDLSRILSIESKLRTIENSIGNSKSSDESSCIVVAQTQICWGMKQVKGTNHVRNVNFLFPEKFISPPVVTNGINAKGSGYAFAVYDHSITNESYTVNIVETDAGRDSVTDVYVNYIAIGNLL